MRVLKNQDWLIALLVIVSLALIGYGFLLWPGKIPYSPYSDITAYHLAAKEVLSHSWHAGRGLPFWRADQLAGGPAFTNPNALYTYPLHGLFYVVAPAAAMGWTFWLHLVIGAWAFYALGHSLGLERWPRILMAVAGLFNFKLLMAVYAGWLSVLPSITLFPLLFAVVFRLMKSPGPGNALAVAVTGALCLHTGQLQLVYYSVCFLIAYLLLTLAMSWRSGCHLEVRHTIGLLSCSSVLAIGMAAYLLWPLAAEAPLISRSLASVEFFRSGHSLGVRHLLTLFYPEALGSPLDGSYPDVELWEDVAYFGLLPLLLACVGATRGWRRPTTRFLALGFIISMLLALDTPLVRLPYEFLPGFHLFRLPGRMLFLTAFFGIALAGVGFQEILVRLRERGIGTWRLALITASMILVIAIEGMAHGYQYINMVEQKDVLPTTDYGRFLATDRTIFRIAPVGLDTISYGWVAAMKLQSISGYEPFNLRSYQQYFSVMQSGREGQEDATVWTDLTRVTRWDLLDALNVKYLLAPSSLQLPRDRFEPVATFRNQPVFMYYRGMERIDIFVYRNKNMLPRAFWAERVMLVSDEDQMRAEVRRSDLKGIAIVDGIRSMPEFHQGSPSDFVRIGEGADGYLTVETESQADRFLVISEVWHPGWTATLDGRGHPLYRTNLALMGAWLPAGRHRLFLAFRPLHWRAALGISVFSWTAFLAWLLAYVVRSRRICRKA
jgi:hypothetical protein